MKIFLEIFMKKIIYIVLAIICIPIFWALYSFSQFLFIIPEISKFTEKNKTILITLHNESELRPTSGFLSAFILLTNTENGWVLDFHDSYDIEAPKKSEKILAPDIIERRFSNDIRYQGWVFRDSNFSLDYSVNARTAISFLQYDERYKDLNISAVVAVDMHAIGEIIDAVGGVEFNGKMITSNNIFSLLEQEVKTFDRKDEQAWLGRKNGMKPLANSIIKKSVFSFRNWSNISSTAKKLFNEQHILFYSSDKNVQKIFREKKWTGEIFINKKSISYEIPWGINFANMGGKKGDRYIDKSIRSTFSIDSRGNVAERIRIHLDHEGTRNLHSDRYFGYVRIIKPKGTILKKYEGTFLEEPKETSSSIDGVSEFDLFFWVDEGDNTALDMTFTYPKYIRILPTGLRTLDFQIISQPGIVNMPVSFAFQGFADSIINTGKTVCIHTKTRENISWCNFSFPLKEENRLFVSTGRDLQKPVFEDVIYLDDGKKIRIQFSEELQKVNISDVILESNNKNIKIIDVKNKPRAIEIVLENKLNNSQRNFYDITIKNLSDIAGNKYKEYSTSVAYPKYKEN